MTKDEFIEYYAFNSGLTIEQLMTVSAGICYFDVCDCGDEICKGWAKYYYSDLDFAE